MFGKKEKLANWIATIAALLSGLASLLQQNVGN